MSALQQIDGRLRAPLSAANAEHARGRRVVGYVGDDIPVELILAANALPVRLCGMPGSTPQADRYLESSFGPAYRSLLEQWLDGGFDFLDAIVFPRSNDTAQRLYYYVSELQRRGVHQGPRSLIYDLARVQRSTSALHSVAATKALAAELGTIEHELNDALDRVRARASFLRNWSGLRVDDPALPGSVVSRAWRALQLDWTSQFETTARECISAAPRIAAKQRLLLAGSTPPDERFHLAAEARDAVIVDEFFDEAPVHSAMRWLSSGASFDAIAGAYRSHTSTAVALLRNPDILIERARRAGATAVVLWFVEQDEGIVWEVPRQIARLENAGIPVLSLTRQRWDADATCVAAVQDFIDSLQASAR